MPELTVNPARLLPCVCALALAACDAPVQPTGWTLEVSAPVAGEVWVDGVFDLVSPLRPTVLTVPSPPPFTVTFIGPDGPLTVVDAPGPRVDLRHFVEGPAPVRGALVELRVQALDGPAQVVGVAGGQVFAGAADGDVIRLAVPDRPDLVLVGLWRDDGRASHLARRPVPEPGLVTDRVLVMAPEVALDQSLPVTVSGGPGGALTAELTAGGLRTGLLLGAGRIDPGVAVGIPRPVAIDGGLGVWVSVEDGGATRRARRTLEAALTFDGDGAALDWSDPPGVLPAARPPESAAWLDVAERAWTLDDLGSPSWLELTIDGRGDCLGRPWRVITAPAERVEVPAAVGVDPLDAPMILLRVTAVSVQGADLAELLDDPPDPVALPGRLAVKRTASVDSAWRTGQVDCPEHPLRGAYALGGAGVACSERDPPATAVIGRCGALVPLVDGTAACGVFADGGFDAAVGGRWSVDVGDARLTLDGPEGPIELFRRVDPLARPPADAVGDWSRFSLSRQPVDADGRATGPAVVVESGVATPVATIGLDGTVVVRAEQWALDARLVEADADTGRAEVDAAGCPARPDAVTLSWSGDAVQIVGEATGIGRRWILDLQR